MKKLLNELKELFSSLGSAMKNHKKITLGVLLVIVFVVGGLLVKTGYDNVKVIKPEKQLTEEEILMNDIDELNMQKSENEMEIQMLQDQKQMMQENGDEVDKSIDKDIAKYEKENKEIEKKIEKKHEKIIDLQYVGEEPVKVEEPKETKEYPKTLFVGLGLVGFSILVAICVFVIPNLKYVFRFFKKIFSKKKKDEESI